MSDPIWNAVDAYFEDRLVGEDEALSLTIQDSAAAGLPAIAVSAAQGKMLRLMALSIGAKRILEVGTLGGYSAIWLARAPGFAATKARASNSAKAARSVIVTKRHGNSLP